ncbi:MAG: cytochrome c oxidase accessory protein FixG [Lentimonas sp.]|jgi:cytochrome c oxidase accessory protein FixG
MSKINQPNRESLITINRDGSRKFLHPADVSGKFTNWRRLFALTLIGVYVSLPWIPINGNPAVFLDVLNRRFHLFGLTFAAQDLWLAFFFISGVGFSLFFITALFGRLWCGWACPQTVFLEHVYRRIERWIEGDATKRRQLDVAPWNFEKFSKRGVKQIIFAIISLMIAHLFLAYFISIPQLYQWMQEKPEENWGAFVFVFIASALIYFNFAWFREQLCLVICPYGRLQSALIDDDSIIIGYDEKRGEPRGKAKQTGIGDCIDCTRCVQVCPTGIDIRQGLQIECIGCSNCIDACDTIMTKLNRPKGLIRYDSQNGLAGKKKRVLRPRIILYFVLMLIGATAMTLSVMQLRSANMNIVRMTGAPYFITETTVRNQYMLRVINKTSETKTYTVNSNAPDQTYTMEGNEDGIRVEPMGEEVRPVIISIQKEHYKGRFTLELSLIAPDDHSIITREVEFIGPNAELLRQHNAKNTAKEVTP